MKSKHTQFLFGHRDTPEMPDKFRAAIDDNDAKDDETNAATMVVRKMYVPTHTHASAFVNSVHLLMTIRKLNIEEKL